MRYSVCLCTFHFHCWTLLWSQSVGKWVRGRWGRTEDGVMGDKGRRMVDFDWSGPFTFEFIRINFISSLDSRSYSLINTILDVINGKDETDFVSFICYLIVFWPSVPLSPAPQRYSNKMFLFSFIHFNFLHKLINPMTPCLLTDSPPCSALHRAQSQSQRSLLKNRLVHWSMHFPHSLRSIHLNYLHPNVQSMNNSFVIFNMSAWQR